jgi:hypothetical protein
LVLDLPVVVALVMFSPIAVIVVTLAVETAGLLEFGAHYGQRVRLRDHVRLVLGALPYQWLLALAAVRAVTRHVRQDNSWEKTLHVGAHREPRLATVTEEAGG